MTFSLEHRRKLKEAWKHRANKIAWNKGLKIGDQCRKKKQYKAYTCPCGVVKYAYPSQRRKYCSKSCRSIYTNSGANLIKAQRRRQRLKLPTKIESIVGDYLMKVGVESVAQKALGERFQADYFLPKFKLVIECDGNYWHSFPKVVERDKKKDELITRLGFTVLRLKEHEILDGKFATKINERIYVV